eukprot:scaffold863_cov215-Skeletonema_menzelii.AAC.11
MANGSYLKQNGQLGVGRTPGSTKVLDRETGRLVDCTAELCQYGEYYQDIGWVNYSPYIANGGHGLAISANTAPEKQNAMADFLMFAGSKAQTDKYTIQNATADQSIYTAQDPTRKSHLVPDKWIAQGYDEELSKEYTQSLMKTALSKNLVVDIRFAKSSDIYGILSEQVLDHLNSYTGKSEEELAAERIRIGNVIAEQWTKTISTYDQLGDTIKPILETYQVERGVYVPNELKNQINNIIPVGVAFSALGSKIWRLNRLMKAASGFKRITIKVKDVMVPFFTLLGINIVLLLVWTVVDPLRWVRTVTGRDSDGSIESVGACVTNGSAVSKAMSSLLFIVNLLALGLALIQAYKARGISIEYSESHYVAMMAFSLTHSLSSSHPHLYCSGNPVTSYFVKTVVIFFVSMSLLLWIFAPKIYYARNPQNSDSANRSSPYGSTGSQAGASSSMYTGPTSHELNKLDTAAPITDAAMDEITETVNELSLNAKEWRPNVGFAPTPTNNKSTESSSASYNNHPSFSSSDNASNNDDRMSAQAAVAVNGTHFFGSAAAHNSSQSNSWEGGGGHHHHTSAAQAAPRTQTTVPSYHYQQATNNSNRPPRATLRNTLSLPSDEYHHYRELTLQSQAEMAPNDERHKEVPSSFCRAYCLDDHQNANNINTTTRSSFGYPTRLFRITSTSDGNLYCLRRMDSIRCVSHKIVQTVMHQWLSNPSGRDKTTASSSGGFDHPGIVRWYKCFISQRAVFFIHNYHAGAVTFKERFFNTPRGENGVPLPESFIWS